MSPTPLPLLTRATRPVLVLCALLMARPALADPFPPAWEGGDGDAVHFAPVPWPADPGPGLCGHTCGDWKPYTRFQNSVNDPRIRDESNGGTAPQNYVNVASSCSDRALPSVYYNLHAHPSDPRLDVIHFRWRVEQPAHTYATGPSAGAVSTGDPWSSALWTVLFDIDGTGYRDLAAHLDGSSGRPSAAVDLLVGIYGKIPTQSVSYLDDPENIIALGHNPTGFTDTATGRLLNFQGSLTPAPSWPNGASETVWDYGTSRAVLVSTRPCTEYFVDYQIPVALLDASAHGGPRIDRSTPISMLFCTANSLNNPFQKDCALNRAWAADPNNPGPFGDYISFDQETPYSQPIIRSVTATSPGTCLETYTLEATVQDTLWVDTHGVVTTSLAAVSFWTYYDVDGDGVSNDGSVWTWAADAAPVPGTLNRFAASWDGRGLPRGRYLVGVQAVDDRTRVDDGMAPGAVDHRTFSYVTSDANGRAYVDGQWRIDPADFPEHAPAMAPSASEDWYGNPLITGVQVATIGVDVAVNACGVSPRLLASGTPREVAPNEPVTFTLTVSNADNPFPVLLSELSDTLPPGFVYVPSTTTGEFWTSDPSVSGQTLTWTFPEPITIPARGEVVLQFTANASPIPGDYNNVASASTSQGELESDPVPVTVYAARVELSMTPSRFSVPADGDTFVIFEMPWSNSSAVTLENGTLTTTLPPDVTFVGCAGAICAFDPGTRRVTWTLGALDPFEAGTVSVSLTVDPTWAAPTLTLSATLSAETPDGASISKTASASVAVKVPRAAFSLTKDTAAARVAPAGSVTWTLDYRNYGDAPAAGTRIVDTLPAGFTFASCSVVGNPHFTGCTHQSGVVTFHGANAQGVSIAAGQSGRVTVTATAAAAPFTYPNPAVNSAVVQWDNGTSPTATSAVGITGQYCAAVFYFRRGADNLLGTLRPARVQAPTTTAAYSTAIADIVATAFADHSTHTDQLVFEQADTFAQPVDLSGQTLTINFNLGAVQGGAETRVILRNATTNTTIATSSPFQISNGQSWYTYTVVVPANTTLGAGQRLRWFFQFRKPGGTRDIVFHYDSTQFNSRSSFCVAAAPANLAVSTSVDKALVLAAPELLTWSMKYANTGGVQTTGTALTATLPANVTACQYSTDGLTWLGCSAAGSNPAQHVFNLGTLAAGATGTVFVRGLSPAGAVSGTTLTQTAALGSAQTAPVTATATTTVGPLGPPGGTPALTLDKKVDRTTLGPDATVTYTLVVANVGLAPTATVTVTDPLPVSGYYRYVEGSIAGGDARTVDGQTLRWTLGPIGSGESRVLTFQMRTAASGLPSGQTPVDNIATASEPTACPTPASPGCTSPSARVVIEGRPELSFTKSAAPTAEAGAILSYTLTVANTGSATATGVTVVDPIPAFTTFVRTTEGVGTFDALANRVVFAVGELEPGASRTVGLEVRVLETLPLGQTPIANVASTRADNAKELSATATTVVTGEPRLELSAFGPASLPSPVASLLVAAQESVVLRMSGAEGVEVGDHLFVGGRVVRVMRIARGLVTVDAPITAPLGAPVHKSGQYVLDYRNVGSAEALEVMLEVALPIDWLFVAADHPPVSAPAVGQTGPLTFELGDLPVGSSGRRILTLIPLRTGTLTAELNDARYCTGDGPAQCRAEVLTLVGGLRVSKRTTTPDVSVWPDGGLASYVITVSNSLPAPVSGVSVTDLLPPGFTFVVGSSTPAPALVDGQPIWSNLTVPADGELVLSFSAAISAAQGSGTYDNEVRLVVPAGVGVTGFDPLATVAEDVTVAGAGFGVVRGFAFRDEVPLGAHDEGEVGLEGLVVELDDGLGEPLIAVTDAAGAFMRLVPAGTWSVRLAETPDNAALLSGLRLHAAFPAVVPLTVGAGAEHRVDFGFVSSVSSGLSSVIASPVDGVPADGTASSTVIVTLVGDDGELVSSFPPAAFTVIVSGAAESSPVTPTADGRYSFEVTNTRAEVVTVTVLVTGFALEDQPTIGFVAGPPNGLASHVVAVPASGVLADGIETSWVTVYLRDAQGNVIANVPPGQFDIAISGSAIPGAISEVAPGEYRFPVTNTVGEAVTVEVSVGGVTLDDSPEIGFVAHAHEVTVTVIGAGRVSPTSRLVPHGEATTFEVEAEPGHTFASASGCASSYSAELHEVLTELITEPCRIVVVFEPVTWSVTARVDGAGGSIGPAQSDVPHGETLALTVTPASGFAVATVTGCGGAYDASTLTFTTGPITGPCEVVATFVQRGPWARVEADEERSPIDEEVELTVQVVDEDGAAVEAVAWVCVEASSEDATPVLSGAVPAGDGDAGETFCGFTDEQGRLRIALGSGRQGRVTVRVTGPAPDAVAELEVLFTDNCPEVEDPDQADLDGDGLGDACDPDLDGDGVDNETDLCPAVADPSQGDLDDDTIGDACDPDADGDEVSDTGDNCPRVANPEQGDLDEDGEGDACDEDRDGDGVPDTSDVCPSFPNPDQGLPCAPDRDGDGVADGEDLCPDTYDPDQGDLDEDGSGDVCDADRDGDEVADAVDNCPEASQPAQDDLDADGVGDACDPDVDGDGLKDTDEAELGTDPRLVDSDADGLEDGAEVELHETDPLVWDTDGGGEGDGDEVDVGRDPLDAEDDFGRGGFVVTGGGCGGAPSGAGLGLGLGLALMALALIRRRGGGAPRGGAAG